MRERARPARIERIRHLPEEANTGLGSEVVLGSILRATVTDDEDPAVTPARRT